MTLLPNPHSALHPAFPKSSNTGESRHKLTRAPVVGGLAGVFSLAGLLLFRRPTPYATASKGIIVASQLRRPWSITGWKRWVGAFSFGSLTTVGMTSVMVFASMSPTERDAKRLEISERQRLFLDSFHSLTMQEQKTKNVPSLPAGTSRARNSFGAPSGPRGGGGGSGSKHPVQANPGGPNEPGDIVRNGPHLGEFLSGEIEPVPIANTNYMWESENPIEDLERHMSMLLQRREKLALEAEAIWAWLSEKERDYYNIPGQKEDSPGKAANLRYIELLGSLHTKTWLQVSSYDWMIADTNKRIEQVKSAAADKNGQVTWRAGCSDLASKESPDHALKLLQIAAQSAKQQQDELKQINQSIAMSMVDPNFDSKEETQVFDPAQGKMVGEKEMIMKAKDQVQALLRETKAYEESVEQVVKDAKKKEI